MQSFPIENKKHIVLEGEENKDDILMTHIIELDDDKKRTKCHIKEDSCKHLLMDYIEKNSLEETFYLSEIIYNSSPFQIFMNFNFNKSFINNNNVIKDVPFSNFIIECIIFEIQKVLNEHYEFIQEDNLEKICFCTFKKEIQEDVNYNFKFMFPYCKIPLNDYKGLYKCIIKNLNKNKTIKNFTIKPIVEQWSKIIDFKIPTCNELYGSDEREIYGFYKDIDENEIKKDITENKNIIKEKLEDIFFIDFHLCFENDNNIDNYDLEEFLPLFSSICYFNVFINKKKSLHSESIISNSYSMSSENEMNEKLLLDIFLNMIDKKRWFQKFTFIDIIKSFHNNYINDVELGYQKLIEKCQLIFDNNKLPEFFKNKSLEKICKDEYDNIFPYENFITYKTIAWYAKIDSPIEYSKWHEEWCRETMVEGVLSCKDTSLAKCFYKCYWLDYIYDPIEKLWYVFKHNIWNKIYEANDVFMCLHEDFKSKIDSLKHTYNLISSNTINEDVKREADEIVNNCQKLLNFKTGSKLQDYSFNKRIIEASKKYFVMNDFNQIINRNYNILGICNGVIEASSDSIYSRNGKPEDYITKKINCFYNEKYNWDDPKVEESLEYFKQVYPDYELRNFVLKFFASILRGGNKNKIMPVFIGEGNNSKSKIVQIMETIFGSYCIKSPISILNDIGSNAGSATPHLTLTIGNRLSVIDEIGQNRILSAEDFKKLTGGDSVYVRGLHKEAKKEKMSCKFMIVCNGIGDIKGIDKASLERIAFIPHISEWTKFPKGPNQYKMDPNFDDKIPSMCNAIFWILIQYYYKYCNEGLFFPDVVKASTENHWNNSDPFKIYETERIKKVRGGYISLKQLHDDIKNWFRETFPRRALPDQIIIKKTFERNWGKMIGDGWTDRRIEETLYNPNQLNTEVEKSKRSINTESNFIYDDDDDDSEDEILDLKNKDVYINPIPPNKRKEINVDVI